MFQVFNESGVLQSNANMQNVVFAGRFSVSIFNGTRRFRTGVYAQCTCAIGDTYGVFVDVSYDVGTSEIVIVANGSATIQVLLFARNNQLSERSNCGLRVYDASGQLCYSSDYRPLAIEGDRFFSGRIEFGSSQVANVPSGTYLFNPPFSGAYPHGSAGNPQFGESGGTVLVSNCWRVGNGDIARGIRQVGLLPFYTKYLNPPDSLVLLVDGGKY